MSVIFILSLQGPEGQLTFPMRGFSFHWLQAVFQPQRVGDFVTAFQRSFFLGLLAMVITVVLSVMAGLAFRSQFIGSNLAFFLTIASLIVPSILVSLGIGILFSLLNLDSLFVCPGRTSHLDPTLCLFDYVGNIWSLQSGL